jgi:WD40 repeat protein
MTRAEGRPSAVSLAFSRDGARLAAGLLDRGVTIWDARTGRRVRRLAAHAGTVSAVAFSADGRRLASGGGDALRVWDAEREGAFLTLLGGPEGVRSAGFSADGERAYARVSGGRLHAWRVADWQPTDRQAGLAAPPDSAHGGEVRSPDGSLVLRWGRTLTLGDASGGAPRVSLPPAEKGFACAAIAPSGACFAAGTPDSAAIYSASNGTVLHALETQGPTACLAFSPDGRRLAAGGRRGVRLWDVGSGRELIDLHEHDGWVTAVAFSPDGRTLLTGGEDGKLHVWVAADWRDPQADLTAWKAALYGTWLSVAPNQ